MAESQIERWEVWFQGRVQGVGFRYTAQRVAAPLAVTGFVQNRADGTVRIVAEGEPLELQALLDGIGRELGRHIHASGRDTRRPTGEFDDFSIRY